MLAEAHSEDCFAAVADRLLAKGWSPIPSWGKTPCIPWKAYQWRQPSHLEVLGWQRAYPSANTQLVMGPESVGLDFDADDGAEAMRLYDTADEVFGPSPVIRVGRYPRTMRLYQPARLSAQKPAANVEILGRGHLAVIFGVHPLTQEPYRHVGLASPLDIRPRDLPPITRRQMEQFRREVAGQCAAPSSPVACDRTNPRVGPTGITFAAAMGGVAQGRRHTAMFSIASACRGFGLSEEVALIRVSDAAARCRPPFSAAEAIEVVRWCYAHFPAGTPKAGSTPDGDDVPALLRIAFERAQQSASTKYGQLLAIAADLQRLLGDEPVALPQLRLAELFKCSQRYVSDLIRDAVDDGQLVVADPDYVPHITAKTYWAVG